VLHESSPAPSQELTYPVVRAHHGVIFTSCGGCFHPTLGLRHQHMALPSRDHRCQHAEIAAITRPLPPELFCDSVVRFSATPSVSLPLPKDWLGPCSRSECHGSSIGNRSVCLPKSLFWMRTQIGIWILAYK
jgi:hypothetical protein